MTLAPDSVLGDQYKISYVADDRRDGPIYRAYDQRDGRRVLLCTFDTAHYDPDTTRAIAEQLTSLEAPALLRLLDHFVISGGYALVAEDPGGQDLDRLIRDQGGALPEASMLEQSRLLLMALAKAHQARPPLHLGDLRSSDIWATPDRELRLTPFVFVRQIGSGPSPYRAPELLQEGSEPTPTSDLYAMGAALYQLATGWSPPNVQQRQAGTPLVPPRGLNPQLSPLAEQAIMRALELRTSNRYHATHEMLRSIEMVQLMAGRSLGAGPDGMPTSPQQPPPLETPVFTAPPLPPPQASVAPAAPSAPPHAPLYPGPNFGPGATAPQAYAPQAAQSYAPQAPAQRGGLSGCWIAALIAFFFVLAMFCLGVLLLVFGPGRALFERALSGAALSQPTAVSTLSQPTAAAASPAPSTAPTANAQAGALPVLGPNAISLANVEALTQTGELTSTALGPAAYSPDGGTMAVGVDHQVLLYDSQTQDRLAVLDASGETVNTLAWSPDGRRLAVGSLGSDDVLIFAADGPGRPADRLRGHSNFVRSLAWSPDGAVIASGSADQTVKLWDATTGAELHTLSGHSDLLGGVAFSPDSQILASASRDGSVRLWDVSSGEQNGAWSYVAPLDPLTSAPYWMTGVAFSPDGSLLAAGSIDGIVRVWELPDAEPRYELSGHTDWVVIRGVAFSPDGKTLASASRDSTVRLWDMDSGSERAVLEGHQLQVISVAWNDTGDQLLSTSDQDGRLLVWDAARGQLDTTFQLGEGLITAIAFAPNNQLLGTTSLSGVARLHQLDGGEPRALQGTLPVAQGLAFLSDDLMVALSDQGDVALWSLGSGRRERVLEGGEGAATSVAASSDGELIAAGSSEGTITIWDATTGQEQRQISGLPGSIFHLALSSDKRLLAAYSNSSAQGSSGVSVLAIWETDSGQLLHSFEHDALLTSMAFVPASYKLLVTDRAGTLTAYEARLGQELHRESAPQGWFTTLAINPDGALLAAGGVDGLIYLYDTASYEPLMAYNGSAGDLLALTFRPDGEQLAYSGRDGTVRLLAIR